MRYSLLASLSLFLLLGISCRHTDLNSPPGTLLDSVTSTAVSNPTFRSGVKLKYDGNDNLVQYIVNNGAITQFGYDAQNRLTSVLARSSTNPGFSVGDTLVYSANGRIVRSYRYASGTASPIPSRTYVFDNNNRLILDSIYAAPYIGLARIFFKYNYNANNDLQSRVLYAFNSVSSTGYNYTTSDSLVNTFDTNENPYYRCSFAFYNIYFNTFNRSSNTNDLVVYDDNIGLVFSKHNLISSTYFRGTTMQPGTIMSYNSTYYANGLLRNQVMSYSFSTNYDVRNEFLYR